MAKTERARSHARRWAPTVIAGLAALLANGCFFGSDDDDDYCTYHYEECYGVPAGGGYYTTVDADYVLDTDLGEGAGFFVEYYSGGRWALWTSCDTALYGYSCLWDADVFVHGAAIDSIEEYDTEVGDWVERRGANSLTFSTETEYGYDAIEFTTAPGADVEIAVALDGASAPAYFVWYGNGKVQSGAPSSPVVFTPNTP